MLFLLNLTTTQITDFCGLLLADWLTAEETMVLFRAQMSWINHRGEVGVEMESQTKDPCRLCSGGGDMLQLSCSIRFSHCMSRHSVECDIIRLSAVSSMLANQWCTLNNGQKGVEHCRRGLSAEAGSKPTLYLEFSKQRALCLSDFWYLQLTKWFVLM